MPCHHIILHDMLINVHEIRMKLSSGVANPQLHLKPVVLANCYFFLSESINWSLESGVRMYFRGLSKFANVGTRLNRA